MPDIALAVFFTVYSLYLLIIECNLTKPKQNLLEYANYCQEYGHISEFNNYMIGCCLY